MKTNLQFLPRVCEVKVKPLEGGRGEGEGNFVILNLKANSCYYWPVLFFLCVKGGPVLLSFSEDVTMAGC